MKCGKCGKDFDDLFNASKDESGTVCAVCYVILSDEIVKRDGLFDLKERRESAKNKEQ